MNGQSNKGNTLLRIFRKATKNDNPSWGSTNGKTNGTTMAASRLDSSV